MVNKVILVGSVGKDPEVKTIGTDNKVASFTIATYEKFKKDGEIKEKTTWHNIKAWGKLAEIVEKYVKKGAKLYVEGKINNDSYEKDGTKHYFSEVIISEMKMLNDKKEQSTEPQQQSSEVISPEVIEPDSDLPF